MAISPYRLIDIERWEVTKEYKLTSHGLSNMQCRQPRNLDSTMAPWDTYFYQPFVACMCRCYLEQTLWRARCFTTWTFGENEETSSRLSQEWSTTSSPTNSLSRRRSSFTFSGQVSSIPAPRSVLGSLSHFRDDSFISFLMISILMTTYFLVTGSQALQLSSTNTRKMSS